MADCLFCRLAAGAIPSNTVYEDDLIMAFHDLHPKAPVHVLVIPKVHVVNLLDPAAQNPSLMGHLLTKLPDIAQLAGIRSGFRLQQNNGADAGQEIMHLHFHVLGQASTQ